MVLFVISWTCLNKIKRKRSSKVWDDFPLPPLTLFHSLSYILSIFLLPNRIQNIFLLEKDNLVLEWEVECSSPGGLCCALVTVFSNGWCWVYVPVQSPHDVGWGWGFAIWHTKRPIWLYEITNMPPNHINNTYFSTLVICKVSQLVFSCFFLFSLSISL